LKKEQSHETNPDAAFGFQWRLKLTFDENMFTFDPDLRIVDFTFDTTIPETKRIIMGAVFHLVDTNAMYSRSMRKTWNDLPVHRDVLRFLRPRGFEIVGPDDKIVGDLCLLHLLRGSKILTLLLFHLRLLLVLLLLSAVHA